MPKSEEMNYVAPAPDPAGTPTVAQKLAALKSGSEYSSSSSYGSGGGGSSYGSSGGGSSYGGGGSSYGGGGSSYGGGGGMMGSQQASGMQLGGETTLAVDKGFGDFINKKWRPMMAVIYMVTCTTDFILFPIGWAMIQAIYNNQVTTQWLPLTIQGAGLYHVAMGAILGLAAYGRSQEKIAGKA